MFLSSWLGSVFPVPALLSHEMFMATGASFSFLKDTIACKALTSRLETAEFGISSRSSRLGQQPGRSRSVDPGTCNFFELAPSDFPDLFKPSRNTFRSMPSPSDVKCLCLRQTGLSNKPRKVSGPHQSQSIRGNPDAQSRPD